MSGHDDGSPGWATRIRRWLWLDRTQRTDNREADRGFYPGGPPVYVSRRAPSRRFLLAIVAVGVFIALLIMGIRDADAHPAGAQLTLVDEPAHVVWMQAEDG